jgi:RNA polymerase sigma-70 factor, ECF subfamily
VLDPGVASQVFVRPELSAAARKGVVTDQPTEVEVLRKAAGGDEASFVALYERHRAAVFRFACRMLGSVAQAEDVTQECFLGLVRRPERFRGEAASLRTYLCAAARNIAFAHLRRQAREALVEAFDEDSGLPGEQGPLRGLMEAEAAEAVRTAVQSLPLLQREAVILFEYEDMTLAEIATVAGTDVGTIKSRLHRARQRLKRLLEPWMTRAASAPLRAVKERR